jgi:hypothetical protein
VNFRESKDRPPFISSLHFFNLTPYFCNRMVPYLLRTATFVTYLLRLP